MRNAFAAEIETLADSDVRIVMLSGDIGNRLFDKLRGKHPNRFINCGVAEANMMGVAAGLALSGLRPIVYTITPFTTTRCLEQIRVDVCYHKAPVVIVGTGSGLAYSELGPTHQSLDDVAVLRAFPDLTIMTPCDVPELIGCLRAAMRHSGPVYIRIGKKGEPQIHTGDVNIEIGRAIELSTGVDVTFLVSGFIMPEALKAADILRQRNLKVGIVSFPTVKPLDTIFLEMLTTRTKLFVSIEEHGIIGGLGSAVAEWRSSKTSANPLLIIGAKDEFLHVIGDQNYTRDYYNLSSKKIAQGVISYLDSSK